MSLPTMQTLIAIPSPINDIVEQLGANDLPYAIPIHPNLVHFTIGLFAIGIAFDFAGAFYPLEKRVFRFLALPVTRTGFHDVGWYNVLACSVITFFTVAAGFYEMLLAVPLPGIRSVIGQNAIDTMLWHAIGGVALLLIIVAMTIWRGYQRFCVEKRSRPPGDLALPRERSFHSGCDGRARKSRGLACQRIWCAHHSRPTDRRRR